MSLSATDFISIYNIRKGMETSNALAASKTREKEHNDISKQVEEFLKLGRNIDVIENGHGSGKTNLSPLTQQQINPVLANAIKNLRSAFGNNLDIKQDMESGKYKAYYKGEQLGNMKTSLSKAETAIRCEALRDRNELKAGKRKRNSAFKTLQTRATQGTGELPSQC